jgi:hypothetical protein
MRRVSVRHGVAVLALIAVCFVPVTAFADTGEIRIPPGASLPSDQEKIQPPIGFWDVLLLVLIEARIDQQMR